MASVSIHGLCCKSCGYTASFIDDEGVEQLFAVPSNELTCPFCKRSTVSYLTKGPSGAFMTADEIRLAFTGFGLPGERIINPELLHELFTEVGSKEVKLETSPVGRVLIRSIVFKNGKEIHLGPSSFGVAAFKLTEE